jgi:argininosuccinate lyase
MKKHYETLGKGIPTDKQIEHFTVGNDRELDLVPKYDAGSIAHAKMLGKLVLTDSETDFLVSALENIIKMLKTEISKSKTVLKTHSKIDEYLLT